MQKTKTKKKKKKEKKKEKKKKKKAKNPDTNNEPGYKNGLGVLKRSQAYNEKREKRNNEKNRTAKLGKH